MTTNAATTAAPSPKLTKEEKAKQFFDEMVRMEAAEKVLGDLKILAISPSGVGKTHFIGSYTKGPILVFGFDPGAHLTLQKSKNPNIIYKDCTEKNSANPTAYENFAKLWNDLESRGVFEYLAANNGLVAIDSLTTLSDAIMAKMRQLNNKLTKYDPPHQQDYQKQMIVLQRVIQDFNTLPCFGIMTAHEEMVKNEETGGVYISPLIVGKLREKVGLYFSEVYCMSAKNDRRVFRFAPNGLYRVAKSRFLDPKENNGVMENITLDDIVERYLTPNMSF